MNTANLPNLDALLKLPPPPDEFIKHAYTAPIGGAACLYRIIAHLLHRLAVAEEANERLLSILKIETEEVRPWNKNPRPPYINGATVGPATADLLKFVRDSIALCRSEKT